MKPRGTIRLRIKNPKKPQRKYEAEFYVVEGAANAILSAEAMEKMGLATFHRADYEEVFMTIHNTPKSNSKTKIDELNLKDPELKKILTQHAAVFNEELGCMPGKVRFEVEPGAKPVRVPIRNVPLALQKPLQQELKEMVMAGVITPVTEPTDWLHGLVIVKKPDGTIRICIDPRPLNKALKRAHFRIPSLEEILPNLAKARLFTILDARKGFWQCELDEETSKLLTFGTPFGRYRYLRMSMGTSPSQEIMQRKMREAIEGLRGVEVIVDDFVIFGEGETIEEIKQSHNRNLKAFLQRMQELNIRLNFEKGRFAVKQATYMGHLLSDKGVLPDPKKIEAIRLFPTPENIKDLER